MLRSVRPAAPWALTLAIAIAIPLAVGGGGAHGHPRPVRSAWRTVLRVAGAGGPPVLAFEPNGAGIVAWDAGADVSALAPHARVGTLAAGGVALATVTAQADGDSSLALGGVTTGRQHAVAELRPGAPERVTVVDGGSGPLALAGYMTGETALATSLGGTGILLRVHPSRAASWSPAVLLTRVREPVAQLALALDWRGDALVAFAIGGRVYARERHWWGELGPLQRVAAGPGAVTALGALISDDGRAIVAWRSLAGAGVSTRLEVSARHVRFAGAAAHTLERDAPALHAASLRLLRLSTGRVVVGWTGASAGGPAVRIDPVSVAGPQAGIAMAGSLCDLVAGPRGDAEALWSSGRSLYAARGLDVGRGSAVFAAGEAVGRGGCSDAAVAVRPTDDVPAVAWIAGGVLRATVRVAGPQASGVEGSSTPSSTPSSSPTRQTSSRSSSTSTQAPAENGKTT